MIYELAAPALLAAGYMLTGLVLVHALWSTVQELLSEYERQESGAVLALVVLLWPLLALVVLVEWMDDQWPPGGAS